MSNVDIGIVSVTIIGATLCQRELDKIITREALDIGFLVASCNLSKIIHQVNASDWDGLADTIVEAGKKLVLAGARFIVIPSNTPHYAYDKIQEKLSVPVLNLIDITAKHCAEREIKKIAVLGTRQTMQGGLYEQYLDRYQIETIKLDDAMVDKIDQLIKNHLVHGQLAPDLQAEIEAYLATLEDCDGFILGCTELPEVYPETLALKPAIDTTKLLAVHALEYAKSLLPSYSATMFRK